MSNDTLIDTDLEAVNGGFIGETVSNSGGGSIGESVSNNAPSTGQNGCTRGYTTETTDRRGYCTAHEA